MDTQRLMIVLRGLAGAIAGGILGFLIFRWMARQGFYGIVIPGALVGLGAGLAARGRSRLLGVLCCIGALILAMVAEWLVFPFKIDGSFRFFLAHVHELQPVTLLMMAIGAAFAFWLGQGR